MKDISTIIAFAIKKGQLIEKRHAMIQEQEKLCLEIDRLTKEIEELDKTISKNAYSIFDFEGGNPI